MAYVLFTPPATHAVHFDAVFASNPLRDRKAPLGHLLGAPALVVLLKNLGVQYATHLGKESSEPVPTDDARALARFTARLVAWPIAKDVMTASCARAYEWLLIRRVYADDPRAGGSFVRGECGWALRRARAGCAARADAGRAGVGDAGRSNHSLLPPGGHHPSPTPPALTATPVPIHRVRHSRASPADVYKASVEADEAARRLAGGGPRDLLSLLSSRWAQAVHTFGVVPAPALVSNAAIFTVDEGTLLVGWARRRYRWRAANATLGNPGALPEERRAAHRELVATDDAASHTAVVYESLELAVRCSSAVLVEAAAAACGTFVWPGVGTFVFDLLGGLAVWVV